MHYHLKTPTYFTLYSCGHMFYQYIHKMEAGHKVKEVFPLHYADIITHIHAKGAFTEYGNA
jgi:hypothetical protein